jgi:hypothetical protein
MGIKFKVGDIIQHKKYNDILKVIAIEDDCYRLEHNIVIKITTQDNWKILSKKED